MKKLFLSFLLVLLFPLSTSAHDELIKVNQVEIATEYTHHVEIVAKTKLGQDLPYLGKAEVIITNLTTKQVVNVDLHPMFAKFFHYGANVNLDKNTKYKMVFKTHPPTFMRDVSTRDKWIEHKEFEIEFDASKELTDMIGIGKDSTEDMDVEFFIMPAKSMYEIEHAGDNHSGHDEQKEEVQKPLYDLPGYGLFFIIGSIGGVAAGLAISTILAKRNVSKSK